MKISSAYSTNLCSHSDNDCGIISLHSDAPTGGICGYVAGRIEACYSDAMAIGGDAGGICGYFAGTMQYCYYAGKCDNAIGYNGMNYTIKHCVSVTGLDGRSYSAQGVMQAEVNTIYNAGGENPVCSNWKSSYSSTVLPEKHVISTKDVLTSGEATYILNGEVNPDADGVTLYWYQEIGQDKMPTLLNASEEGKVYAAIKCPGLPNLKFANVPMEAGEHIYEDGFFCKYCDRLDENGAFLQDNTWQIGDAATLYAFAKYINAGGTIMNAVLTNDIDLNPGMVIEIDEDGDLLSSTENLTLWETIGTRSHPYKGTFDGQGHSIFHLYIKDNAQGMFSCSGAVICNLGLQESYIYSQNNYILSSFGSGTVKNCFSTAILKGRGYYSYYSYEQNYRIYGISNAKAENCYFAGKIYATNGNQVYSGGTSSVNCYSTDERYYGTATITTNDSCIKVTADQVTNGELAHLLQKTVAGGAEAWSQGENGYPVPKAGAEEPHYFDETGSCICGESGAPKLKFESVSLYLKDNITYCAT